MTAPAARHLGFLDQTGEALAPMAAALAAAMLPPWWRVEAWALDPGPAVDPLAQQALAEWGLDPRPARRYAAADLPRPGVLVALGPVVAERPTDIQWMHWTLPPRGTGMGALRSQRDRIRHLLEEWAVNFA